MTPERDAPALPFPTLTNVPYGGHERQVLDFWKADSPGPTPVLFYIHGGGWLSNDKSHIELENGIDAFLEAGISVVSINYQYIKPKGQRRKLRSRRQLRATKGLR